MKKKRTATLIAVVSSLLLASITARGDDVLQTNWIEMVRGFKDTESGVQVRDVTRDDTGTTHLQIAIPKVRMSDVANMEEVRVIGQRKPNFELKNLIPEFEYEWVDDYDNDFYGLLVHFKEEPSIPLRLFFSSESGFLQP
ncbi:MAG: hypothetical protein ABR612_01585 [Chromatocurvus sp.]